MAIEKDGRIGLQRHPSGDSSLSGRKLSGDTEAASSILQESTRTNVSSPDTSRSDFRGPGGPGVSPPGIPPTKAAGPPSTESSGPSSTEPAGLPAQFAGRIPTKALTGPSPGGLSTLGPTSGGRPNLQEGLAASPQIRQAPRGQPAEAPGGGSSSPDKITKESEAPPARDQNKAQAEGGKDHLDIRGAKGENQNGGSGGAKVATALNGDDKAKASKPVTTTAVSSTPSSKTKPAGKAPNPTPKPSATPPPISKLAAEKKTPSTVSPGFVKPRPKSPTRPLELPSRLTQPTAAAAAKNKNAPPPTTHRPASRTATSGKGIGRSSSVASRQRPSIGPPPKQPAKDYPVPKKEARVDEGFLARMMRPTQASANKVAEKAAVPTTPPRNRAASTNKKSASAKSGPTRKIASRTASATNSAAATPESKKDGPSAKNVAKKLEQMPIAEETITVSKRAGDDVPSKISEEKVTAPKVEKKANGPAVTESKANAIKLTEKADLPKMVENGDVTRPVKEKESNACENREDTLNQAANHSSLPKPAEPVEEAASPLKSPEKPSDAMFAAFMNPASQNTEAPQANGNHEKGENGNAFAPGVEAKAEALEAEYDEQETW